MDPLDQPTMGPLPPPLLDSSSFDPLDQPTQGALPPPGFDQLPSPCGDLPPPDLRMTTYSSEHDSYLDVHPEDPPEPPSRGPQRQPATFGEMVLTRYAADKASADADGSSGAFDASGAVWAATNPSPSTLVPSPAATTAVAASVAAGESGVGSAASNSAASVLAASPDWAATVAASASTGNSAAAAAVSTSTGDLGKSSSTIEQLEADLALLKGRSAASGAGNLATKDRLAQVSVTRPT